MSGDGGMRWASADARAADAEHATEHLVTALRAELGEGPVDLCLVFSSATPARATETILGELRTSLTGISPKTLTDRLRSLEDHGLIDRRIYAEVPPRVEYTLTPAGRSLEPVLAALADWGRVHAV